MLSLPVILPYEIIRFLNLHYFHGVFYCYVLAQFPSIYDHFSRVRYFGCT